MILDTLDHAEKYESLHPGFPKGFDFLRRPDLTERPDGRYEIDGTRVLAIMDHASGRDLRDGLLEGHRNYIDIQYVISGSESIGWSPCEDLTISTAYDAEKDLIFFSEKPDSLIRVPPGSFAIFFPEDAHLPLIGSGIIHKTVVKIAI